MADYILPEVRRAKWSLCETSGPGCGNSRAFPVVEGELGSQGLNTPSTTHLWETLDKLIALVLLTISQIEEHIGNAYILVCCDGDR